MEWLFINRLRSGPEPSDTITLSTTFTMVTLGVSFVAAYALGWVVLRLVPDPKAQPRVKGVGGRWQGRGLDQFWFWFFVAHIPISLCLDCQSIFPSSWLPSPLVAFNTWYKAWSRDPVMNFAGTGSREWAWLDVFLHMELFVQVPCFFAAAYGLWKNDKRVYPLILIYATQCLTTVIPTLYYLLTSNTSTLHPISPPLSTAEFASLLGSYLPFFFLPLGMMVDMSARLVRIVNLAQGAGLMSAPVGGQVGEGVKTGKAGVKEGKEDKKRR